MATVTDSAPRNDSVIGTIRRFGWGLGDQVLSSATNFMLGVFVARVVTPRDFGAFSVVYAVFTLSLGIIRAVICEPLVIRYSSVSEDRWRDGVRVSAGAAVAVGSIVGLGSVAGALLFGGPLGVTLAIVGASLPALLLQDIWRYSFFARDRGGAAFLNDLTWGVAMFATMGLVMHAERHTIGWFTAAWAGAGTIAALVGLFQIKIAPGGPLTGLQWLRRHSDLAPRFLAEFTITSGTSSLIVFGLGTLIGLEQLGQLRAGQLALGPLNILFVGAGMATVPEGVRLLRKSPRRLAQASRWISLALAGGVLSWGALVLALPADIGKLALGANWEGARALVVPLSIGTIGYGLTFGPATGLRSLAAAARSLRARSWDSVTSILIVFIGASVAGAPGAAWGYAVTGCLRIPNWWWHFTMALREHEEAVHERARTARSG